MGKCGSKKKPLKKVAEYCAMMKEARGGIKKLVRRLEHESMGKIPEEVSSKIPGISRIRKIEEPTDLSKTDMISVMNTLRHSGLPLASQGRMHKAMYKVQENPLSLMGAYGRKMQGRDSVKNLVGGVNALERSTTARKGGTNLLRRSTPSPAKSDRSAILHQLINNRQNPYNDFARYRTKRSYNDDVILAKIRAAREARRVK